LGRGVCEEPQSVMEGYIYEVFHDVGKINLSANEKWNGRWGWVVESFQNAIVGDDRGLKRIPEPHSIVLFLNFLFNFECLRPRFHHNEAVI